MNSPTVPANVPSTGPLLVSVNPVDDYTRRAAALSLRGECDLILVVHERANPRYGHTRNGQLPKGSPCLGAAATPETVIERF